MPARRPALIATLCCLVALAAGCGSGGAGSKISSALSGHSTVTTVTTPGSTVVSTITPEPAAETSSDSTVPGWAWALLGALLVGVLVAVYALGKSRRDRRSAPPATPPAAPPAPQVERNLAERQQILIGELGRRVQGGWTVLSQTTDTAILQRGTEHIELRVDEYGTLHEGPPTA